MARTGDGLRRSFTPESIELFGWHRPAFLSVETLRPHAGLDKVGFVARRLIGCCARTLKRRKAVAWVLPLQARPISQT